MKEIEGRARWLSPNNISNAPIYIRCSAYSPSYSPLNGFQLCSFSGYSKTTIHDTI